LALAQNLKCTLSYRYGAIAEIGGNKGRLIARPGFCT
jgi:hypothetical protein